jgi:hypothetical protein
MAANEDPAYWVTVVVVDAGGGATGTCWVSVVVVEVVTGAGSGSWLAQALTKRRPAMTRAQRSIVFIR